MSNPTPKFTPAQLWQYLDYCTDTGAIRLKPDAHHPDIKRFYGDCIWLKGYNYSFPRLSYYMHHGIMPTQLHRINNPLDIRVENLTPKVKRASTTPTTRTTTTTTLAQRQQHAYDLLPDNDKLKIDRLRKLIANRQQLIQSKIRNIAAHKVTSHKVT
jgi:hypothetical protein